MPLPPGTSLATVCQPAEYEEKGHTLYLSFCLVPELVLNAGLLSNGLEARFAPPVPFKEAASTHIHPKFALFSPHIRSGNACALLQDAPGLQQPLAAHLIMLNCSCRRRNIFLPLQQNRDISPKNSTTNKPLHMLQTMSFPMSRIKKQLSRFLERAWVYNTRSREAAPTEGNSLHRVPLNHAKRKPPNPSPRLPVN